MDVEASAFVRGTGTAVDATLPKSRQGDDKPQRYDTAEYRTLGYFLLPLDDRDGEKNL